MPASSHQTLTQLFQTTFPGLTLPDPKTFTAFLQQDKLNCFVEKEAPFQAILTKLTENTYQYLICFPPSSRLSSDIIAGISRLIISQPNIPIVLYWPWEGSERESNVALRVSLIPQDGQRIGYRTELLNPCEGYPITTRPPLQSFIRELDEYLPQFQLKLMEPSYVNEPLEGDSPYWTALSLFLRLCEDDKHYQQDFMKWRAENPTALTPLDYVKAGASALSEFTPCLHPGLYHFEQSLPLLNMMLWVHQLGDKVIPRQIKVLSPQGVLQLIRAGVLLSLILDGVNREEGKINERGFATLQLIPYIFFAHLLTKGLRKIIPANVITNILFHLVSLLSTGTRLFINLYSIMPPGTPIQRETVVPRFVLPWVEEMTTELQIHSMRFIMMALVFLIIEQLIIMTLVFEIKEQFSGKPQVGLRALAARSLQRLETHITPYLYDKVDQKAGFRALVMLSIQCFMGFITPFLFVLPRWKSRQDAEERALLSIQTRCEAPCRLSLITSAEARSTGQAFFNERITQLEASKPGEIIHCDLKISTIDQLCEQVKFSCTTLLLFKNSPSTQTILLPPGIPSNIQVHPPEEWISCYNPAGES